jgi:hypothetical protein
VQSDERPSWLWHLIATANVVYFGAFGTVIWAFGRRDVTADKLLRDPIAVAGGPLHAGLLSNIGILVWAIGAGACLLAAAALWGVADAGRECRLLLGVGVLTTVLAADDLLMFHEDVGIGPRWLGLSEELIIGTLGAATLALLVVYRDLVWRMATRWVLLIAAAGFAVSIGIDLVDDRMNYVIEEDLAKMVGVWNWTLGWGVGAALLVRRALSQGAAAAPSAGRDRRDHDPLPVGAPDGPRRPSGTV